MAFDTSMYGRIDLNTPIRLGQILDPASIQQRKAEQMATQENIAQLQDARTLRDLLSGAPDIQTAASRLAQAGKWKEASALQSQIQALEIGKQKAQQAQNQQAVDQAIYAASIAPTDESFKAVLTAKGIPEEQHAAALASLPKDPEERRALISLSPAKRAELDFQMRKQSEAKAADLARQEAKDAAAEKRAAAREDAADRRMEMRIASSQGKGGSSQKAPQGYRYTESGDLEAIPGGPADTKRIAAEEKAKASAQRSVDLADQSLSAIDSLLNDKGLDYITGMWSKAPVVPGTSQARADAKAKQLEGQSFLQAFQMLKGGGAITEAEGRKATAAVARLDRAQSTKDYKDALQELRGIIERGKGRAERGEVAKEAPAPYKSKSGAIIELE